jgi:hypothetical protein
MAYILEQDLMYITPTDLTAANPGYLSGQRYPEPDMDGEQITFGTRPRHPQARGCFTMGTTVDGNFIVLGERPPIQ